MQTLFCQALRTIGAILVILVAEYVIERCFVMRAPCLTQPRKPRNNPGRALTTTRQHQPVTNALSRLSVRGFFISGDQTMAHLVENMAYINAKPWHGLGNRLPQNQPLEVWQKAAGMNFEIKETEVLYSVSEGVGLHVKTSPDNKVLFRSDTQP